MELIPLILLGVFIVYLAMSIVALINIHRFNLKYFNFGYILYRSTFDRKFYKWVNKDGIYQKEIGNYVFIPDMKTGYFVSRFRLFRHINFVYTSFGPSLTIFGEFYEIEGKIYTFFKVFYGALIFPALLIIFPLALLIIGLLKGMIGIVLFGTAMLIVVFIALYILFQFQKIKMKVMSDELKGLLGQ